MGLQKTGTTTIQEDFLSSHPGYLGKGSKNNGWISSSDLQELEKAAATSFMRDKDELEYIASGFIDKIKKNIETTDYKGPIIISREDFCSWPLEDDWEYAKWPIGTVDYFDNPRTGILPAAHFIKTYLKPLWDPFGNIRLIVTLRNQPDYLASMYAQRSNKRQQASQDDFEYQIDMLINSGDISINWFNLVKSLEYAVGEENVTVLLFENINDKSFWYKLSRSIDENYGYFKKNIDSNNKRNAKRIKNNSWRIQKFNYSHHYVVRKIKKKFLQRDYAKALFVSPVKEFFRLLGFLLPGKEKESIYLTDEIRTRIKKSCAESNKRLSNHIGVDLGDLGY